MKTTTLVSSAVLVVALGLACEASAGAIVGRNVTTGAVIFRDDGFENDTVGLAPNAPEVGSWSVTQGSGVALVTDAAVPGGRNGTRYLQEQRGVPDVTQPNATATFSAAVSGSDVLEFRFALAMAYACHIELLSDTGATLANVSIAGSACYLYNSDWSKITTTGLPLPPANTWMDVTLRYSADGSVYELTVNGATAAATFAGDAGTLGRVRFNTNDANSTFYVDGMDEPAPVTASAIIGRNATTGTVVFRDDGFENDTAGTAPNLPTVGSWSVSQGNGVALVTDAAVPGAQDGAKCLDGHRGVPPDPRPLARANFCPAVSGSDVLEFRFALALAGGCHLELLSPTRDVLANILPTAGWGWALYSGDWSKYTPAGLPPPANTWMDVTLRYAADGSVYQVIVDGVTYAAAFTGDAGTLGGLRFNTDGTTPYYVDAVTIPAPGTVIILR